ncbi:hypothetical protein KPL40_19695 [Clostridium gasigenes]|uniref:hypothetical protein n=1 Tax=Clostridium gasigenes TaxID=94869 RepID=UPI001C0D6BE2|nr:hypothetical protein [Clostridium gasigenes]MBU3134628.1 hypothetical protein [Clostridium gasigenes]
MIGILLIFILIIIFSSKIINYRFTKIELMFISIFTMLTGISILLLFSISNNDNLIFILHLITSFLIVYGISTGIQAVKKTKK